MRFKESVGNLAESLAERTWLWQVDAVEDTLSGLGWHKSMTVGDETAAHRDAYSRAGSPDLNVYVENGCPFMVTVVLERFPNADSLNSVEYDDKVDEFYAAFRSYSEEVSTLLGKPDFSDGGAVDGFPEDQDAVWASVWNYPSSRLMILQEHQDRELPMTVRLVLTPRPQ